MASTYDITPIVALHHCQPTTIEQNLQQLIALPQSNKKAYILSWPIAFKTFIHSISVLLAAPKPISHRFLIGNKDLPPSHDSPSYLAYSSTTSLLPSPSPGYDLARVESLECSSKVVVFETWRVLKQLSDGTKFQIGTQILIRGPRWGHNRIIIREGALTSIIGWAKHWVCLKLGLEGESCFEEPDSNVAVLIPCEFFEFSKEDSRYYFWNAWRMEGSLKAMRPTILHQIELEDIELLYAPYNTHPNPLYPSQVHTSRKFQMYDRSFDVGSGFELRPLPPLQ
ncbi:hypothetical protein BKA70DRAFT_1227333 [Coprinopsis sp. MPI-PUGE-AT-0042]|nr:hypothetical protein BKA70DRAFT_1227333 [Coprinopsis sp. MPI-PUGE-AT-0042]